MLITNQNKLNRYDNEYIKQERPDDIVQFKGDSATNVYAPIEDKG